MHPWKRPPARREFLGFAGTLAMSGVVASAAPDIPQKPYQSYADLLVGLRERGHVPRVLALAPDRSPIVAIRAGGSKGPPILISAGSHSTEQAGVTAAVTLIDALATRHPLYVVPCRDPIGLTGFAHALSLSLGETPKLSTLADAEHLLRERGEILLDADDTLLVLIGEHGYATRNLYGRLKKGDPVLEPLRGRRIWFPSRYDDAPGAGLFERAYTLVVTPDGEVLHLNRFHDTAWAPAEVQAIRRLMTEIKPGLTLDLHEYNGDAFWFSARRQRTDEEEAWELRMARAAIRAVADSGARLAADNYSPGGFFSKLERGVYWLDPRKRGEGLNLADFAAHAHGFAFTVETGMRQPFPDRVRTSMLTAQTIVKVFEERHGG